MRQTMKRLLVRRAAKTTLRKLESLPTSLAAEPVVGALAATVRACRDSSSLDPTTARFARTIETIRRRYEGSAEEIEIVDYGAGPPEAQRTESEMRTGTPATITLGQACRASKPFFWSLFLFHLVREVKPRRVVELGTCLGVSAAYQASAMALNGVDSELVTLEGAPELAARSRRHFDELALQVEVVEGPFQETFEQVLGQSQAIDLLFVDGHHDEQATVRYFHQARPFLSPDAWVVFDDIDWSVGMRRAWAALRVEEGVWSADLGDLGILALRSESEVGDPNPAGLDLAVPKELVRHAQLA